MRFPWQKKENHSEPATEPPVKNLCYKIYSVTETGPTRTNNEDHVTWFHPNHTKDIFFAMVADGMGGHNAGEVASHLACSVAEHYIQINALHKNIPDLLHLLFRQMHGTIVDAARQNPAYTGMGTTAAAIFIRDERITFGHVGDSRIYQFRNNRLKQLSTDQTLVNQMLREGKIKATDAEAGQMKHLLLQALGTAKTIEPEIGESFDAKAGDYYFLCSDGIYDVLSNEEIGTLMLMNKPPLIIECIRALCFERKARDNFSALLIDINTCNHLHADTITREQNVML